MTMAGAGAEFKAGWRILIAGAAGTAFGISALPFYTLGVFTKPVAAEFGWGREIVQLGFTVQMVGMILVAWAYGMLIDRIGARRVALWSQVGLGVALMALAAVGGKAQWFGVWLLVALLGAGTSPLTWTRGIAGWFDKARGAALGLALVGTGLTGFLAPPLITRLIAAEGWRAGYLALGASVILVALPLCWRFFHDREAAADAAPHEGMEFAEAVRTWRFWAMIIVFAAITFGASGLISNLIPLLTDRGMTAVEAAGYASVAGLSVIIGRVVAGFLLDRFWAPGVATAFLVLPLLTCVVLMDAGLPSPAMLTLAAACVGLAAGAEFDLVAFMVTRYFGLKRYGVIYAWQMAGLLFSSGFAPPLFGFAYERFGSYTPMLQLGLVLFATPLLLLTMGRYPRFSEA